MSNVYNGTAEKNMQFSLPINQYGSFEGEKEDEEYRLYYLQSRMATKDNFPFFVDLLAIISRPSTLLREFRFAGMSVSQQSRP